MLRVLIYTARIMMEIEAVVSGKVQGVAYRAFVDDAAVKLDLTGYTHNNSDGTVTVVAQGETESLKELVEWLNEGSLSARVESVEVSWRSPRKTYHDFSVLH